MSEFNFDFDLADISNLSKEIKKELSKQGGKQQRFDAIKMISYLNKYLEQVSSVEGTIQKIISQSRISALEQMKFMQIAKSSNDDDMYQQAQVNYEKARKQMATELQNTKAIEYVSATFKSGYQIINRLREYITNSKIKYHVAVEGKGVKSKSFIYEIDESHLMKYLEPDVYSFTQALIKSDAELDFNMRYRATKKRSEEGTILQSDLEKTIPNTENRSTLWSKGYTVYITVKQWVMNNKEISKGLGINFGHFLETYYAMGGNKNNHVPTGYSNIKFLELMLNLQNSVEFYRGGDFEDIQLKSNTSTLTNIKTIKAAIRNIIQILSNPNEYEYNLQAYFNQDNKVDKELSTLKGRVPQDLINLIENLDN